LDFAKLERQAWGTECLSRDFDQEGYEDVFKEENIEP
jgi:hypothetical protein